MTISILAGAQFTPIPMRVVLEVYTSCVLFLSRFFCHDKADPMIFNSDKKKIRRVLRPVDAKAHTCTLIKLSCPTLSPARVKNTLSAHLFDKFVRALSQYRAQNLAIDELVEMVRECFDQRQVGYSRSTSVPQDIVAEILSLE